jgi:hypothetical protein
MQRTGCWETQKSDVDLTRREKPVLIKELNLSRGSRMCHGGQYRRTTPHPHYWPKQSLSDAERTPELSEIQDRLEFQEQEFLEHHLQARGFLVVTNPHFMYPRLQGLPGD